MLPVSPNGAAPSPVARQRGLDLRFSSALARKCRSLGVPLTADALCVSVADQRMTWYRRVGPCPPLGGGVRYAARKTFVISTSRFGMGQLAGSHRTPLGLHRVAQKIGGGWPLGTIFRSRQVAGFLWHGQPQAAIVHRILWLEGLEPGFNRGGRVDTRARFIYIHGFSDESTLGRPASRGCVHMGAADLLPLFDQLRRGALVWITDRPIRARQPAAAETETGCPRAKSLLLLSTDNRRTRNSGSGGPWASR